MASPARKSPCATCGKVRVAYKCDGCEQEFCYDHLGEHRQSLVKGLDEVENQRNSFRQTLAEQTTDLRRHRLMQEIDQWEKESIETIQQTAEQARQLVLKHTDGHIQAVETRLIKLTKELQESREEEDLNEFHLNQLKQKLQELEEQLQKPSNISIQIENASTLIKKISVLVPSDSGGQSAANASTSTKWIENGVTVAGGNEPGGRLDQLHHPLGIYISADQTIYVADQFNHRIVEWRKGATSGRVVAGGNGEGDRNDQLCYPFSVIVDERNNSLIICDNFNRRVVRWSGRDMRNGEIIISNVDCCAIALDNDGYLYVSDNSKHEVRRWNIGEMNGTLVAGGNGEGNRFDQLNQCFDIFVDQNQSVYVSDWGNHRVMKWVRDAIEGTVVAGGQGQGSGLEQLSGPRGIVVDQDDTVYVADQNNHRVMRWSKGATQGTIVVGGNESGDQANQLNVPLSLSFDRENNLYVADNGNHRIQKYNIDTH